MEIYQGSEAEAHWQELRERLQRGEVAVFPTDTIYGFTVDARNHQAVEKVLALKQRRTPVSCIPHSVKWLRGLVADPFRALFDSKLEEYRGRYTMLWPTARGEQILHPLVQTGSLIGVRRPDHWILKFAEWSGIPLTTTSVNRTGQAPMRSLETLDPELQHGIDFMVDEGLLENPPSTLVRRDSPEFSQQERV